MTRISRGKALTVRIIPASAEIIRFLDSIWLNLDSLRGLASISKNVVCRVFESS